MGSKQHEIEQNDVRIRVSGCNATVTCQRPITVGIIADLHFPFEDPIAMVLARQVLEAAQPDLLILNGDIWDAYGVSPWPVRPRKRVAFAEEVRTVRERVARLLAWFPIPVIMLAGNHESRIQRYLWRRAQELAELDELTIPGLLRLPDRVIYLSHADEYRPLEEFACAQVRLGRLYVLHGDTLKGPPYTVNAARNTFLKLGKPAVVGHYHVCQSWTQADYEGSVSGAWVVPCLCLPRAHYNAAKVMTQGLGIVKLEPDGYFEVELVPFLRRERRAIFRGQRFEVDLVKGWQ